MLSEALIANPVSSGVLSEPTGEDRKYRIAVVASGSRGDVQPYIALALALTERGHEVTVVSERRMQSLVEEDFRLPYRSIEGDPTGLLFEPHAQKPLREGSLMALIKLTAEWEKKFGKRTILESYRMALADAEVIISAALSLMPSYCVAEKLGAIWVPMILGPTIATSEFPVWPLAGIIPCSCLNKWSYRLLFSQLWANDRKDINSWRKEDLKLPEIVNKRGIDEIIEAIRPPVIVACSPLICPKQRAPGDYPSYAHMTGFVFVPRTVDSAIEDRVRSFLAVDPSPFLGADANPRPVIYLGFGSMPVPDPNELIQLSIDICNQARCRAVLVAGWSALFEENSENARLQAAYAEGTILAVKSVPHDWLFPRLNCVVHHGGIGTTAAALRSGVPQIPCPFMLDQPHNAKLVVKLGCSPGYVTYNKHITARKISVLIEKLLPRNRSSMSVGRAGEVQDYLVGNTFLDRAREIGEIIRNESAGSLGRICRVIEEHAATIKGRGEEAVGGYTS